MSEVHDIERELAKLGEDPPSAEELAWLEGGELEGADEVQMFARLCEVAEPLDDPSLSELEQRRAWQRIEQRESSRAGGGAWRWPLAGAVLAVAAAAAVVISWPKPDAGAEQVAELGAKVRASLAALDDGKSDGQRAGEIAADYERRLAERRSNPQEGG